MKLACPQCSSDIPASDINIQSAIAKCSRCGSVFSFADTLGVAAAPTAWNKSKVEMPRGFSVETEGTDLLIRRRWYSPRVYFLAFFCVFWDGFLVFWYSIVLLKHGPLVMALFPLIHVAVGVALTYFTVATFVNRTLIRVSSSEVSVSHAPLPWPGNKTLPRESIDQLFCQERVSNSRNGASFSYIVNVQQPGGGRVELVSGLEDPAQALYIEQQVEGYLGIRDRPVPGEMRPM